MKAKDVTEKPSAPAASTPRTGSASTPELSDADRAAIKRVAEHDQKQLEHWNAQLDIATKQVEYWKRAADHSGAVSIRVEMAKWK